MGRLQALGVVVVDFRAHISRDALKGRVNQHPPPRYIQNPEEKAVYSLPYPHYTQSRHAIRLHDRARGCRAGRTCRGLRSGGRLQQPAPVVSEPNVLSIPTHS